MPLKLSIEYDHSADLFEATLENGAKFTFRRNDIGGKLENNLTLYRQAVVRLLEDKPLRPITDKRRHREEIIRMSAEARVQVVGVRKPEKRYVNLNDLNLDDI